MAYTPTNWQIGDIITAEKLNHIENGIASGGGIKALRCAPSTVTIDGIEYDQVATNELSSPYNFMISNETEDDFNNNLYIPFYVEEENGIEEISTSGGYDYMELSPVETLTGNGNPSGITLKNSTYALILSHNGLVFPKDTEFVPYWSK